VKPRILHSHRDILPSKSTEYQGEAKKRKKRRFGLVSQVEQRRLSIIF
jgi:hypothetical protein